MHTNVVLGDIQKKIKRINNPYLKKLKNTEVDKKIYENYDGINTSLDETNKHSGDILRIRQLEKVGKNGSGTYLYWGYIYNTDEEENLELKDLDKYAVPVCFESYKKLEDMAKDKDQDEIYAFLDFLSNPSNFKKSNTVKYIGHFFKKTIETKKEIIEEFKAYTEPRSTSLAIQLRIEKIQKDYLENHDNSDNTGSVGSSSQYDEAR